MWQTSGRGTVRGRNIRGNTRHGGQEDGSTVSHAPVSRCGDVARQSHWSVQQQHLWSWTQEEKSGCWRIAKASGAELKPVRTEMNTPPQTFGCSRIFFSL